MALSRGNTPPIDMSGMVPNNQRLSNGGVTYNPQDWNKPKK